MIAAVFQRIMLHVVMVGFLVYLISPVVRMIRGNGFTINEADWFIVIPYGVVAIIHEWIRYKRSLPRKKLGS